MWLCFVFGKYVLDVAYGCIMVDMDAYRCIAYGCVTDAYESIRMHTGFIYYLLDLYIYIYIYIYILLLFAY